MFNRLICLCVLGKRTLKYDEFLSCDRSVFSTELDVFSE